MSSPAPKPRYTPHHIDDTLQLPGDPPNVQPGRGRWGLVIAVLIVGVLVVKQWTAPKSAMAAWGTDWDQKLAQSGKSGKPLLVLFTADWCGPCQELKKHVLSEPDVAQKLDAQFELLKVDLTERGGPNSQLAQQYGVRGVPTLLVFNQRGELLTRMSGAGDKETMAKWFDAASAMAR